MEIALVIPAFNEEATIQNVIEEALHYVKKIVVVNDVSTDQTKKILQTLPITLINNRVNLGYAKTLEAGILKAFAQGAEYVITFDGDGQHQAKDLQNYISLINQKKTDLILGRRSFNNRFMESVFGLYSKLRFGFSDPLCGMKAYKKEVFMKYGFLETKYSIGTELTFRAVKDAHSFIEVPITCKKRINESRFANSLKGNLLELRAFWNILFI